MFQCIEQCMDHRALKDVFSFKRELHGHKILSESRRPKSNFRLANALIDHPWQNSQCPRYKTI